ncbi:SusC/RagA family TonB-linked outer membrane protein [Chitinophaga nivalis]|uniref:SusC/RagA family TonB-linked outer membrane protein n=1 Tax=Chitinophaga nivalis TaxID=2991709 RepID=A0ABT3IF75_9BACT|nr:SusC/RagA family TonB-linked outer membrane protein [Chitinophaga nivalis]MCW3467697.1 SusC/RagA family TonB-linked outer membrane protein [Chitinophaga nivalis]MCW3482611.1 SusC/RagA family TonB-linked outer membrane protein [Chitinophaga nivalis]
MKKMLLLFAIPLAIVSQAQAQQRQVTGAVTGSDGNPLPLVAIQIKGTTTGTTTDEKGHFSINVKDNQTVFIVRSNGYQTQEVQVGSESRVTIVLQIDTKELQVVVVTALGIKQEKVTLGYAAQDISGEAMTRTAPSNPLSSLSGKVAGANIITASGTPGAPVRVQMRGATTIVGSNQPLFVIDGLPVDNSETNTAGDGSGTGGVTQSNRMVDINPDDVENITLLKGPAAAALYGSSASNGVVIITTKKGKRSAEGKTFNLSYGVTMNFDKVNKLPDRQNKYAQGFRGGIAAPDYIPPGGSNAYSFGPEIDTLVYDGDGTYLWNRNGRLVGKSSNPGGKKAEVYDPYDFFRTGVGVLHNLSLSGGNTSLGYRISGSYYNQEGIIPLTNFKKTTIAFSTDYKFNNKLNVVTSVNYANSGGRRPQQGSNISGVMLGLLRTPPTFDNSNGISGATDPSAYILGDGLGEQRSYRGRGVYDNPYWTVNMNPYRDNVHRVFGNVGVIFKPFEWLSITERFGGDYSFDNRKQIYSKFSAGFPDGQYFEDQRTTLLINNDIFATFTKKTHDFDYSLLVGQNLYDYTTKYLHTQGDGLSGNDFQGITNTGSNTLSISNSQQRKVAFYGKANIGFKNYLFLELTGRYEGNSTLPVKNQFFFYPAASVSYVFSDALRLENNVFSFGKLRLAYSSVGRGLNPYSLQNYYTRTAPADGWTGGITFPFNGLVGYSKSNTLGNPDLTAERTNQFELGAELRFWDNRVSVDYTYYNGKSKDLLNAVSVAPTSGYSSVYLNAASMTNQGHEVTVNVQPVRTRDFNWNLSINYAQNRNKVVELAKGIDRFDFNGFTGIFVSAIVGKQYGSLYGTGYLRDDQGRLVINDQGQPGDGSYGLPILYAPLQYLGDVNPKWTGSVANNFSYKGFTLSVLFETRQKFDIWNGTWGAMTNFGTSANTLDRNTEKVFEGIKGHLDDNGQLISKGEANDLKGKLDQRYYTSIGSGFTVNEPFVQDASWIRLRELSLGYRFTGKAFFKQKPWFQAITVTATARNLWLKTNYTGVDPETSLFGTQEAQGFDYFNNPGTKTYGFSVKLDF